MRGIILFLICLNLLSLQGDSTYFSQINDTTPGFSATSGDYNATAVSIPLGPYRVDFSTRLENITFEGDYTISGHNESAGSGKDYHVCTYDVGRHALGDNAIGPLEILHPGSGRWKVKVYGYTMSSERTYFNIILITHEHFPDKFNESVKSFDRALELNPELIGAMNYKSLALYDSGKINESIAIIDGSLREEPLNPLTWYVKGLIYEGLSRHNEALQYYNNAIDLSPSYLDAWVKKGSILRTLGRSEESQVAYAEARELGYEG